MLLGITPIKCIPVLLAAAGKIPPLAPQIPPIASIMEYISVNRGSLNAMLPIKIPTFGDTKSNSLPKPAKLSAIACVFGRTLMVSSSAFNVGGKHKDKRCKPDMAFKIWPSTFTMSFGRTITLCATSINGLLSKGLIIDSSAPLATALRKRCANNGCSFRMFDPIIKMRSSSSIS